MIPIDPTYDHSVLLKKFIKRVQFVVEEMESPDLPPDFVLNTLKDTLKTVQLLQQQIEVKETP